MTEPPPGLAALEQHVAATNAPPIIAIESAIVRAVIAYARELERENERLATAEGCFW